VADEVEGAELQRYAELLEVLSEGVLRRDGAEVLPHAGVRRRGVRTGVVASPTDIKKLAARGFDPPDVKPESATEHRPWKRQDVGGGSGRHPR